jgi:hypothetical protein
MYTPGMKKLFFAVLAAALVMPAAAQDAVLVRVSGPVSYLPGGGRKFIKANGGEELLYGDAIRVGKGGIAHVTLAGRGAMLLREETLLSLHGSPRRASLTVDYGEFLIGLTRKLGRNSFQVHTPAAIGSARGTLFWGKSDREDKRTIYAGFGHEVAVAAQGKMVVVTPGKTVIVPLGSPPSEAVPSAFGLEYADNFRIDGSLQGIEALAETKK